MTLCVDTSGIIPFLVPAEKTEEARAFWIRALAGGEALVAPPLLFAETTSVLRRLVYRGIIQHEEAAAALRGFLRLPIELVHVAAVYEDALDLANRLGHGRAYDVQYLAVARIHDCPVVTADRGMAAVAQTLNLEARLIA